MIQDKLLTNNCLIVFQANLRRKELNPKYSFSTKVLDYWPSFIYQFLQKYRSVFFTLIAQIQALVRIFFKKNFFNS